MPSLIYELENNETLLLMYVSGELPAEDRAEVEQMLASDGNLRLELEEIRSAMADSMGVLSALDRTEPVSVSAESIAIRKVSRMMNQWKVDRLQAEPAAVARKTWRYPMWVYPTSAVASILLGVLVWWGLSSPLASEGTLAANSSSSGGGLIMSPAETRRNDVQYTAAPTDTSEDKAVQLEMSFSPEPSGLADAEAQANTLVSRANDASISVFPE